MAAKNIYAEVVARPPFIPVSLVLVNFNHNSIITICISTVVFFLQTNLSKAITAPPTGARSMKGTPVSKGRTVAPARVISRLEDAHLIQKVRLQNNRLNNDYLLQFTGKIP